MINKRSPDLSCNEEEYEKAKSLHETAYTKTTIRTETKHVIYALTCLIAKILKPTSGKHSSS